MPSSLIVVLLHQNQQRLSSFQYRIIILPLDRIFHFGQHSAHLLVFYAHHLRRPMAHAGGFLECRKEQCFLHCEMALHMLLEGIHLFHAFINRPVE